MITAFPEFLTAIIWWSGLLAIVCTLVIVGMAVFFTFEERASRQTPQAQSFTDWDAELSELADWPTR